MFGDWAPDQASADKHIRECRCGEKETGDCTFDEGKTDEESGFVVYTCTVCGREKSGVDGIMIVISGGTATFVGKETVTANATNSSLVRSIPFLESCSFCRYSLCA